jgi:adenine-specific DNA-methyltransferase
VSRKGKGTGAKTKAAGKTRRVRKSTTAARAGKAPGRADTATPALATPAEREVKITAAKGRPMLTWVGKRPLRQIPAFPAQLAEKFALPGAEDAVRGELWDGWPEAYPRGGLLFHGDNKEVLAHLLANGFRGKVNLVYIDPPFDSGADYVRKVALRGPKGTAKMDGEAYTLGEQIQYTDIWANDNYLQFMYERLALLSELLAANGSVYLHCDPRKSHHLRCLLDEIFGSNAFVSEIIWQSADAQSSARRYGPIHNTILYYARSDDRLWNDVRTPLSKSTADTWYTHEEVVETDLVNALGVQLPKGTVRRYNMADLTARKRGGDTEYEWHGVRPPTGRYWAYSRANMEEFDHQGRLAYSSSRRPYLKRYLDEVTGTPPQDLWTDISMLRGIGGVESTDYPTEKPEKLLERIVRISSEPGDIVLDAFIGSGTTAAVAQKLGRRWIGADINKGAIQTTAKRLQGATRAQQDATRELDVEDAPSAPAQLAFTTWRVNDYDLQVQHNEAINLAAEFLGVQRTRTDPYFDGTLGRSLVKVIAFGRPLTPLDLEELKRELDTRRDEDREVTIVCLGVELAAKHWVDDWNALRKGAAAVNRIRLIELRTDSKYGGFLRHEPATARVKVRRSGADMVVEITDFISPSIVERLRQQAGLLSPKIDDWRAIVDCLMIDPAYDGRVFNVVLSDVPERKQDLVRGRYELPAPAGKTAVAVKIVDMLGEEVLSVVEC